MLMKKIVLFLLFMTIGARAFGEDIVAENTLKAAFVYHFIGYTQWGDNKPEYDVCIPDDEDLLKTTKELFKGKLIHGRDLVVVDRSEDCHVLISNDMQFANDTALTIGSLERGALLEFRQVNHKMKFAIDMERMKKVKLKMSSQLLKLAILEHVS
jgi:hypothetical protein